jgi:uncharacterized protein YcbK (DUF882 family)
MSWTRRRVLEASGVIALSALGALASRARAHQALEERRISLKNLHSPESLEVVYRRDGEYLPESLARLERLLRDYRSGEVHSMDPALFDYLYDVARARRVEPVFSVISGYRSPRTDAMLHERSSGVASKSLHMEGRAIDVRLGGVDCATLASSALALQRGGVGYYRRSNFVHLDTGRLRTWRG